MSLFIRLVIAMVALVLITAASVGLLAYRNLEEAILPRALERIETHTRLLAAELESYARSARADVLGFRSAVALEGIVRARLAGGIDPLGGTTEAAWRERMAGRYAAELASKPAYSQFRIIGIDNGGREIVRVDRYGPSGAVRIVPDSELESKRRSRLFHQDDRAACRRCLCVAGRPETGTRPDQDPASSDPARRDADPRPERTTFWDPRDQCRYEADL